jgi:hypothetical protein
MIVEVDEQCDQVDEYGKKKSGGKYDLPWFLFDFKSMFKNPKKEEYNSIPVSWCDTCGSLNIIDICENDFQEKGYCNDCNSLVVKTGSIQKYLLLKDKHKFKWGKRSIEGFNKK